LAANQDLMPARYVLNGCVRYAINACTRPFPFSLNSGVVPVKNKLAGYWITSFGMNFPVR